MLFGFVANDAFTDVGDVLALAVVGAVDGLERDARHGGERHVAPTRGAERRFPSFAVGDHQVSLGSVGGALVIGGDGVEDGILQWWIDGVRVGNYSNVRWRDSAYAQYGSTGLTGFFGTYMDCVWGGSGGAAKTRDDPIDWFKTYISGIVGP